MYTLVSAIGLPKRFGAQWESVDIGHVLVATLFQTYRDLIFTVTRDGETLYVPIEQFRADFSNYQNTAQVMFSNFTGLSLQTVEHLPTSSVRYIEYSDGVRCGYKAFRVRRGEIYPETFPISELHDLEITRPGYSTDLSLLHTHCLISINGFYHMTDRENSRAFIVDGGRSVRQRQLNHFGITSFLNIGKLDKFPILEDYISKPLDTLKDRVKLTFPQDIEGKSVFLVLGGYLLFPEEGVFWQTGENHFELDFKRLPYLDRLLESRHYIDHGPLGLTPLDTNPGAIHVDEAWSDRILLNYLTLSQSFLVVLDAPSYFVNRKALRAFNTPGVFGAYQDPSYPLMVSNGRCVEYWKVHEDGHWAVTVEDSFYRNYLHHRQHFDELNYVTEQLSFDRPFFHSQGHLLEIGAYQVGD